MNKLRLVEELKRKAAIPKQDARQVVELFFDSVATALARGERVEIRGLWSIYVKRYRPYIGRNPKTGKKVKIKAKKLPFFKCGKELKDRVDSEG